MSKELIVSASRHETRVAVLEEDQVVEIFYQRENEYSLAGSIHKGRVIRVLPGMQSAFVDIGLERDAFLYVSDFFEDNDEYDKIVTSVEEKILKLDRPVPPVAVVASIVTSMVASPVAIPIAEPEQAPQAAPEAAVPGAAPPAGAVAGAPAHGRRDERGDRGERDQRGRRGRRRRGHKGAGGTPSVGRGGLPDS